LRARHKKQDLMPKIAASLVFPVSEAPRRNAVVEFDEKGTILAVSQGSASFRELAGVEYYSGILIPGLADMMSGEGRESLWLVSRGIRVTGRIGLPPETGVTDEGEPPPGIGTGNLPADSINPGRSSWKSKYGGMIEYRLFDNPEHFWKFYRGGRQKGIVHVAGAGNNPPGLATLGEIEMIGLMLELQDGPAGLNFPQIMEMAALNGAVAMGCEKLAGTLSPGKQPGLNIIEGADLIKMRLLPGSRLRRIL
jgi:hypothetical protein